MKLSDFRRLKVGDAVSFRKWTGLVQGCGFNSLGHWYVSVRWYGEPPCSYLANSFYSDCLSGRRAVRGLKRAAG